MRDQWTDRLAGARMQVDQRFQPRVEQSQFSSQEWGLIMTAVEFDIEAPQDPEAARMVARTEKLEQIIPELENIQQQMADGQGPRADSGGLVSQLKSLKDSFTGGSGPDAEEREAAAVVLVEDYAAELQDYLVERGRWESICDAAASQRASEE